MEFGTTGAEVQEVAEPATTGVEVQEVAEPAGTSQETANGGRTETDAEHLRAREEAERRAADAERKLAELKAENEARSAALQRMGGENADINALAESLGADPEDILATLSAEQESAKKDIEIKRLQEEVNSAKAEKAMQGALLEVQAIDPGVKSLYELGDAFIEYIGAGLSVENAYYAVKAKEHDTKVVPPKEIGRVNNEPQKKDFFTEAEVDAMSEEQQRANYETIMASMPKWKK